MFKESRFLLFLCVIVALLCISSSAFAAAVTSQQIQMFKALDVEQQNGLLEKLRPGITSGAVRQGNWQEQGDIPQNVVEEPLLKLDDAGEEFDSEPAETEAVHLEDDLQTASSVEKDHIKMFGYDVFQGVPTTFAPATDIPIPSNYIIGPGDELRVQIFGKENFDYGLVVSRDGSLNFPGVGVVNVAGLHFDEVKKQLIQRIKKQFIGVQAHVSMGALRSIRVFVMGNVKRAGSYTVSSLSTLTNALFASGGITNIGSLRKIELKRNGEVITEFDLYDLLMRGDTSADRRLQPGDVIFVPPIGETVKVTGAVTRSAIYELKGQQSIADALSFAGGLLPTAYPQSSRLERIDRSNERRLIDLDLSRDADLRQPLFAGDSIVVSSIIDKVENVVILDGHVERPGRYQWHPGIRISDLIGSIDKLKPQADLRYALVRREVGDQRHISVIKVSLGEALNSPGGEQDIKLHERDTLMVFDLYGDRVQLIEPLVEQLRHQGRMETPESVVTLSGNVRHPGVYPLTEDMHLSDLLEATVDVLPDTDLRYVLIQRERGLSRKLDIQSYDLADTASRTFVDPLLQARDVVYFFSEQADRQEQLQPQLDKLRKQAAFGEPQRIVNIGGRVRYPGSYPYEEGMRISDLIRAAGSLQESAYSLEAEISRYHVNSEIKREVQLSTVNLAGLLQGDPNSDLILQPHDHLNIKELPNWRDSQSVELRGEIKFPGIYPIREGDTLSEVIKRAGGLTELSYPRGAVFMREELREKEQKNLDELRQGLQAELAAINLEQVAEGSGASAAEMSAADDLAKRLESTKALGRLVIDLEALISDNQAKDIILKSGDRLVVPSKSQEISILGEVFHPTSHLFDESVSVSDYINKSGGLTKRADDSRIYVVRANGAVLKSGAGWFTSNVSLQPGDTIVVPLDVDYLSSLRLWTNVTQIVYQLGLAVASWNAVGLF